MEIRKHGVLNNIWFICKPAFKSSPTYIIAFIIEALLYVALPLGASLLNAFVIGMLACQIKIWTILLAVL